MDIKRETKRETKNLVETVVCKYKNVILPESDFSEMKKIWEDEEKLKVPFILNLINQLYRNQQLINYSVYDKIINVMKDKNNDKRDKIIDYIPNILVKLPEGISVRNDKRFDFVNHIYAVVNEV